MELSTIDRSDDESIIAKYIPQMFRQVRPGWKKILVSAELKPYLNKCIKSLDSYLIDKGVTNKIIDRNGIGEYVKPKMHNIFEAFKYFDPNNLKVIIVGQDPYPKPGEAHGLSFSVPNDVPVPKSLNNIYKCLIKQGHLSQTTRPEHGCLVNWAKQGVLLINRYLTRSPTIKKGTKGIWIDGHGDSSEDNLHKFWTIYTDKLIEYLTNKFIKPIVLGEPDRLVLNHNNHVLCILLWGNPAKTLTSSIGSSTELCAVHVFTWKHPVSMFLSESDPTHFIHCTNFSSVNSVLRDPIDWNPDFQPVDNLNYQFHMVGNNNINKLLLKNTLYNDGTSEKINTEINEILSNRKKSKNVPTLSKDNDKESKNNDNDKDKDKDKDKDLNSPKIEPKIEDKSELKIEVVYPLVLSTDGACSKNGDPNALAGFAVYIPESFNGLPNGIDDKMKISSISGKLPKYSPKLYEATLSLELTDIIVEKNTNGRSELYGMIYALITALKIYKSTGIKRPIYIIADSTYVIHLVNYRIWIYLMADENMSNVKQNYDLVLIIKRLLILVSQIIPSSDLLFNEKNGEKNIEKNNDKKINYKAVWNTLIHPDARTDNSKTSKDAPFVKPGWTGLSIMYQHSHMDKTEEAEAVKKGGWELEKMHYNIQADQISVKASKLDHTDIVTQF